jgi:hypothetical protein
LLVGGCESSEWATRIDGRGKELANAVRSPTRGHPNVVECSLDFALFPGGFE